VQVEDERVGDELAEVELVEDCPAALGADCPDGAVKDCPEVGAKGCLASVASSAAFS